MGFWLSILPFYIFCILKQSYTMIWMSAMRNKHISPCNDDWLQWFLCHINEIFLPLILKNMNSCLYTIFESKNMRVFFSEITFKFCFYHLPSHLNSRQYHYLTNTRKYDKHNQDMLEKQPDPCQKEQANPFFQQAFLHHHSLKQSDSLSLLAIWSDCRHNFHVHFSNLRKKDLSITWGTLSTVKHWH